MLSYFLTVGFCSVFSAVSALCVNVFHFVKDLHLPIKNKPTKQAKKPKDKKENNQKTLNNCVCWLSGVLSIALSASLYILSA